MWKDKLQAIVREKNLYDEKINNGAVVNEIQVFLAAVKEEFKLDLPKDYVGILESVNGLEFNGFILYGIDSYLLHTPQNQSVDGLIESNKMWYENEWQKQYIFLGESNSSWYAYDLVDCKYYELDNPSGEKMEVFNSIEDLVEKLLNDSLV